MACTTTLKDYIERTYPERQVEVDADRPLAAHTVVGNAVDGFDISMLKAELVEAIPAATVSVGRVVPTEPTLIPSGGEDKDSVADLPKRRPLTAAAVGGSVVGIAAGVICGITISLAAGVILGVFCGVVAGIVSAIIGGGGRFAGQRAWDQPNAPASDIAVIAVFADTEDEATRAAALLEANGITDVKVVSEQGAWHSPNT